ncbi:MULTISPECIES: molybdate ABC transporter substrate-binding protein [Peptoniphilus]|uniref:molybdate ABC transporter substrate-binding protein n=1 Tax=Peptoniphilus TaxID=162289 RepID=UPI0001DA9A6F|nr:MULTISPECIES: molybdate ABC transporter substrate-binding protein [Peptoniphilus]EFI41929.1 molybdate ABC transporter, periplasmic molybdate-binding protein [Peptoniphilus sp. oral taxon 386 str. F0131]
MNKKLLVLVVTLLVILTACQGKDNKEMGKNDEKKELVVFAAASMTETLEKIKTLYEEEHPEIELIYTFDSSGTLKTQIDEGATCDVFISAALKQMNAIDPKESKEEISNPIDSESRINLLENKVVLVVPNGNVKSIKNFEDLNTDTVSSIALGNSDVPVGQYSEEILTNLGIWNEIQNKITFGSNVKEVTTWISEKAVDCGIIYKTDAFSAGLEVVDEAEEGEINTPVIYPAAILQNSKNAKEAKEFLEYLKSDSAKEIFESVGFAVVE